MIELPPLPVVPPPGGGPPAAVAAPGPALGVTLREWAIVPGRRALRPGPVRLLVTNQGEDGHDLAIRGPGGLRFRTPELRSGRRAAFALKLARRGTYRLTCTLPGHARAGMRARVRVR